MGLVVGQCYRDIGVVVLTQSGPLVMKWVTGLENGYKGTSRRLWGSRGVWGTLGLVRVWH